MLQVDQLVRRNGHGRRGGHAQLCAQGIVQQAGGLVRTVARKNGFFLGGAHAAGELAGDIGRHIEGAVVEQLLGDADHAAHLVGAQGDLTESVVALGNSGFLLDPGGRALAGHQRDLAIAGGGGDLMHQPAHDVFLFQSLDQLMLELIGDGVAALGQRAHLQRIPHLRAAAVQIAHVRPEGVFVCVGRNALPGFRRAQGTGSQGGAHGRVQLALDLRGPLLTLDGVTQIHNLLLHTFIRRGILAGHQAVFTAVLVQKCLRLVPHIAALLAQFKNFAHGVCPPSDHWIVHWNRNAHIAGWRA